MHFIRRVWKRVTRSRLPDFDAMRDGVCRVLSGELDHYELPPGWNFTLLKEPTPGGDGHQNASSDGKRDAEDGRRPRMSCDLSKPHSHAHRGEARLQGMVAPLAESQDAEAAARHCSHRPASRNAGDKARRTDGNHAVPPLHFFADQIHRRIMKAKTAALQGDAV